MLQRMCNALFPAIIVVVVLAGIRAKLKHIEREKAMQQQQEQKNQLQLHKMQFIT